ncbi:HesB/YadR/YfhF family protein [Neobacillus sp. SCS-31]|uniref:HesB/YadR/YfhF family protein n=1 Tax=Neobacillus oceani TaxID=3115292 RepID=UPI003905E888
MHLTIDDKALSWFTDEFEITSPISIRLFPQYNGFGIQHKGYSLAFSAEPALHPSYAAELNGLTFYIEASDQWFFEDTKTILFYDESLKELAVRYEEETNLSN